MKRPAVVTLAARIVVFVALVALLDDWLHR